MGYIITVWGEIYLTTFVNPNDLSAGFVLFTVASYLFMEKHMEVKGELGKKIVCFLGKYSFMAYMVHYAILTEFVGLKINSQAYPLLFPPERTAESAAVRHKAA